jgi:putative addiction module killer protein
MYPSGYTDYTMDIRKTEEFSKWLDGLKDIQARARVLVRIERLAMGNPGDAKAVGEGVSELRIHYGPGYRVYYKQRGSELVILLAGGDKGTQSRDIKIALRLAKNLTVEFLP